VSGCRLPRPGQEVRFTPVAVGQGHDLQAVDWALNIDRATEPQLDLVAETVAQAADPSLAFMLALGPGGPTPIGVFRQVQRPVYGLEMQRQIDAAVERRGPGDLGRPPAGSRHVGGPVVMCWIHAIYGVDPARPTHHTLEDRLRRPHIKRLAVRQRAAGAASPRLPTASR